ncbi:hypothetical protein EB796_023956 [Bugula neritina]|uniref:Uncharacterized protein n=1 Tax=Bugula neritina TaxID=10212 RepID=A0A7J7IVB4_BUGNE|nr:hypothetical protein EB796_023956 [Bugula neritina]
MAYFSKRNTNEMRGRSISHTLLHSITNINALKVYQPHQCYIIEKLPLSWNQALGFILSSFKARKYRLHGSQLLI